MVGDNAAYIRNYSRIALVIAVSVLVPWCTIEAQTITPICAFPPFDVNNLTSRIWESVETRSCINRTGFGEGCHYYFGICQELNHIGSASCVDSSVCEQGTSKQLPAYSLGKYDPNPFNHSASSFGISFLVGFKNGAQYVKRDNTTCDLAVHLIFECNMHMPWVLNANKSTPNIVPVPINIVFNETTCTYEMTMEYAGACIVIPPQPSENDGALGAGTILLIIFLTSVGLYLILGSMYNGIVDGKRGVEVIPNNEFWRALPGNVGAGVLFVITCGRHKKDPYDSI